MTQEIFFGNLFVFVHITLDYSLMHAALQSVFRYWSFDALLIANWLINSSILESWCLHVSFRTIMNFDILHWLETRLCTCMVIWLCSDTNITKMYIPWEIFLLSQIALISEVNKIFLSQKMILSFLLY